MIGYEMGSSLVGQGLHYNHDFGGGDVQAWRKKWNATTTLFLFLLFG